MNLCSDGHEEVCYESNNCPACELLDEILDLRKENEKFERETDDLRAECDTLRECIP